MFSLPPLPRTLRACQADFSSANEKVRLDVARDLARPGNESERDQRIELLLAGLKDTSSSVRRQVLVSLADMRATAAKEAILELLCDPEISVRQMAVMALGEITPPEDDATVGRIATLLSAGAAAIRYQALIAYAHLRPADVASDLLRALSDEDAEIRLVAARLVDEALLPSGAEIPASLRAALVKGCADPAEHVRLLCQLTAAEQGWPAPHDALLKVVNRRLRVKEPRDEQWALELAGQLGLAFAVPGLERRAFGFFGFSTDPFRWVALGALSRMGHQKALGRLIGALSSRRYVDRVLAVQTLGQSARREARDALGQVSHEALDVEAELLEEALGNLAAALSKAPKIS